MKKIIFLMVSFLMFSFGNAQELVTNGNFETGNGSGGWTGNALNVVNLGGNFVNQANVTTVGNPWDVNLSYVLSLTQGKTYKLKFDAWTDNATGSRIMTAGIGLNEAPWTNINDPAVPLTSTPKTFTYTWTCPATSANSRIIFDMGNALGFVFIDNVSLVEVVPTCSDGIQNGTETGVDCGGTCQPCAATGPSSPAPTPPDRPVADVVSIFSNAYANIAVNEWGPNWGPSSASIIDSPISGNATKMIDLNAGQVFAGIDFAPAKFNATPFTHFHMDYYIPNPLPTGQVLNIKLSNHAGTTGETSAIQYTATPTGNSWVQLDIPLSSFTAASDPANLDRSAIAQIVITAARADTNVPVDIYFDNVYFHKNTLGVNDIDATKNGLRIYPNPVTAGETLQINKAVKNVEIINLNGQLMKVSTSNQVNTKGLEKGIYIVKVTNENGEVQTSKVIIK